MSSQDIVFELKLKASLQDAWAYWIDPKLVVRWLSVEANIEPRQEGAYELFWDPTNPHENSTVGCKIITFIPEKVLSFEWRGPPAFADVMNTQPLPTWILMTFEMIHEEKTIIHFRHSGWDISKQWKSARTWQESEWLKAFKELKKMTAEVSQ
jgi:uncharacterized protein YndB with AHSA1/START domain